MPVTEADWIDRDFVAFHAGVRPNQTVCIAFATNERITYLELHAKVDRASAAITKLVGDLRGVPLAILARNSIDYLAFVVACHRTGAVLQPLNWRLSASELEFQLLDAGPALAIYEDEFAAAMQTALKGAPKVRSATMDAFRAEMAAAPDEPFEAAVVGPDAPFVLLYTSGTTGKPKGAILSRINAFWQSYNFAALGDMSPDSVLLCDAPMFHTVGLIAVTWSTLQKGSTFAISDRFIPALTLERLLDDDLGATHYFGVPQIARALIEDPAYKPRALNRLTGFFVGGAPSPHDLIERMFMDGVRIANGFGMSETGTIMHMPLDLDVIRAHPGYVGLTAPVMQVKIMDEQGNEMPDGEPGELCMRGPAVTRGYWGRPDATASAFFGDWFRSGDIGVKRPGDGFFRVLDRSKDMYISGGENVYPAEVESALMRIEGIAETAVIGIPDDRWGEVGCAYVVLKPGVELEPQAVIQACGQWLAPFKRPKHVRFLDAIPRNAAGKMLKTALRSQF